MTPKVYSLDPEKVALSVATKISHYEDMKKVRVTTAIAGLNSWRKKPHMFSRRPPTPYAIRKMYDAWIDRERNYFSKVKVVMLKRSHYLLVYDDSLTGTGPFKTLAMARNWFYNQGR